jgi:hypothetical protein
MVEVGSYRTRGDAELAQSALTVAGIPSVLVADDAGGAYPFDLAGGARLLIDVAHVEEATGVLAGAMHAEERSER